MCAAALFAAAAACGNDDGVGSTTNNRSVFPHYDLVEYGGQPLPAVLQLVVEQPTGGGAAVRCEEQLTSTSLEFTTRTRYSAISSRLLVCDDGRPNEASVVLEPGSYSIRADTVRLIADLTQAGVSHRTFALISADSVNVYRQETTSGAGTVVDQTRLVFLAGH